MGDMTIYTTFKQKTMSTSRFKTINVDQCCHFVSHPQSFPKPNKEVFLPTEVVFVAKPGTLHIYYCNHDDKKHSTELTRRWKEAVQTHMNGHENN